jgi:hypothetical protein
MIDTDAAKSLQNYARLAGFMYLFGIATYMSGDFIVSKFIVPDNFAATAQNIIASDRLCRIGLSLELITSWGTILLAGACYALLKAVDANLALFALMWRVAEATLGGLASINRFAAIENYAGGANGLGINAQQALGKLITAGNVAIFNVSGAFFSAGSLIFFYLLFKSRFIPRALSALGIFASLCIAVMAFATLILTKLPPEMEWGWAPIFAAEISTGLWLFVAGANVKHWNKRVPIAALNVSAQL